jgi:ABC-type uncharacterized transport system permease subunit
VAVGSLSQGPEAARARARAGLSATARRRILIDRGAAIAIRLGGLAVILGVAGIFAFLLFEIAPVLRPARVSVDATAPFVGATPHALFLRGDRVV